MTTILLVDDEHAILELLSMLLEDEGYEVLTAYNGEEGLASLARKRPAIVLCDLMMPVLGGREMCQRMQANPLYRGIPFVVMSAVRGAIRLTDCNYAAIINKPFDLNNLLSVINKLAQPSISS